MEDHEILRKVELAIDILFEKDFTLLERDLNERCISHKLAEYLQVLFNEYNVDCEYNGNSDEDKPEENILGRKRITALTEKLIQKELLTKKQIKEYSEKDLIEKLVYPDIIIHKRGTNNENLCVIEIKKSTSQVSSDYDIIKLESYTSNEYENL